MNAIFVFMVVTIVKTDDYERLISSRSYSKILQFSILNLDRSRNGEDNILKNKKLGLD